MRFPTAILAVLCAVPCFAQERIFRAAAIQCEPRAVVLSVPSKRVTETKVVTSQSVQSRKAYATITIETLPGCDPCERWKSREAHDLRAKGWVVIEAPLTSATSAPFFRICIGDRCYSHRGFMPHSVLRTILSRAGVSPQPAKRAAISARYTTAELRSMIQAKRPGGWTGPVYADVSPRSQVKQHLVGPEHGFHWDQVAGLTHDEALILHDLAPRHGNQIFPTRSKR